MTDIQSREREYDVREDVEQGVKLQEIMELLVAAGYFRARIKGLSSFDKVVGGMVWCMDSCSYDVDVDILFQENSSIGQKIALTEKIVEALPKMGCPYFIEPHQIQGLDFIHIYPVIQWLVKQSVQVREERGDFVRNYTVRQYHLQYGNFEEENFAKNVPKTYEDLLEKYGPKRIFKHKGSPPEDLIRRVKMTLMEYGNRQLEDETSEHNYFERTEQDEEVPREAVKNIISSQSQRLSEVMNQFSDLTVDINETLMSKDVPTESSLLEEKKLLELNLEECLKKQANIKKELENCRLKAAESDKDINNRNVCKIQELVCMEENLKQQERDFRKHCREELDRLQEMLAEAKERSGENRQESLELKCEEERERVQKLRLQIARKNRAISLSQRQLDEIPGRAELTQYQKRFLELYDLVAQKHAETKQFYSMYNTLNDKKFYLTKEFNLLNSILDNYNEAMSSNEGKESFIKQFEGIVLSVKQTKNKVSVKKNDEKLLKDQLSKQLQDLIEQQQTYVQMVQQLKNECKRNEMLFATLKNLTSN